VAFNWIVVPRAMDEAEGLTAMEAIAAAETVSVADPLIPLTLATIAAVPTAREVARPVASMLATAPLLLVHAADWVSSCEEPSVNIPVAVALKDAVCPSAMLEA
jgi:hypothetical protein